MVSSATGPRFGALTLDKSALDQVLTRKEATRLENVQQDLQGPFQRLEKDGIDVHISTGNDSRLGKGFSIISTNRNTQLPVQDNFFRLNTKSSELIPRALEIGMDSAEAVRGLHQEIRDGSIQLRRLDLTPDNEFWAKGVVLEMVRAAERLFTPELSEHIPDNVDALEVTKRATDMVWKRLKQDDFPDTEKGQKRLQMYEEILDKRIERRKKDPFCF